MKKYFALNSDGLIYYLGKHEEWESAENYAYQLGLDHIWVIDEIDAQSWVDSITQELEPCQS